VTCRPRGPIAIHSPHLSTIVISQSLLSIGLSSGLWADLHLHIRILIVQFSSDFNCVCTSFMAQNLVGSFLQGEKR